MNPAGLDFRVVFRSRIGTTIAWSVDPLTPEQQATRQFFYRFGPNDAWAPAKVVAPPAIPPVLKAREGGKTGDVLIPHVVTGPIKDDTTYEVMARFGHEPNVVVATLTVLPVGEVGAYARPRRIEVDGRPQYSNPVYIAGISPEAAKDLAKAIVNQGLEVEAPKEDKT